MGQSRSTIRRGGPRARWPRRALLIVLLAAAIALVWNWQPISANAQVGAAYGARVACACRYIGGRDLESCRADFVEGMDFVSLSEDEEERSVTASVPLLASDTAVWHEGEGCRLQNWRD